MPVELDKDFRDLAEAYDLVSDSQFQNGCLLIDKLGIRPGFTVLDIGCGTGRLGLHLQPMIGKNGCYIGIDPMEERIRVAHEKNSHPNLLFRVGVAEDLGGIDANSADVVLLNWVFHWIADKQKALREILGVLKPGGRLGLAFPPREMQNHTAINRIIDKVLAQKPYREAIAGRESPQKLHSCTTTQLIELLTETGLRLEEAQVKYGERVFSSGKEVIRFNEASFFGNFLNNVPEGLRDQAKQNIETEFDKYQTSHGIPLGYYLLYAVAKK